VTVKLKSYDKLFHEIEQAQAVLASGGTYQQVKLYYRFDGTEHQLFAKRGAGYVRLLGSGGTSVPAVRWLDLDIDGALLAKGRCGSPVLNPREAGLTA
jgi:hypothetical protein